MVNNECVALFQADSKAERNEKKTLRRLLEKLAVGWKGTSSELCFVVGSVEPLGFTIKVN
jgi:hypothetical protein